MENNTINPSDISQAPAQKFLSATTSDRLLNRFVDIIGFFIFVVIIQVLLAVFGFSFKISSDRITAIILITIYYTLFEFIWQKTPGKWLTNTKVVTREGKKPNFSQTLKRTICRYIPFDAFSFLSTGNPIGWHDNFSKTLVVPKKYTEDDVLKIELPNIEKERSTKKIVKIMLIVFTIIIVVGFIIPSIIFQH